MRWARAGPVSSSARVPPASRSRCPLSCRRRPAVQTSARARQRHAVELADRPDGIEMSKQENLRRTAAKLGEQVIAAILARQSRHPAADRLEPRRQRRAAAIDGGLVGGRRFERTSASVVSSSQSRLARQKSRRSIISFMIMTRARRTHQGHRGVPTAIVLCALCSVPLCP